MLNLKRYFFTGLIVVIPLFLTVWLIIFVFRFFDGILGGFINAILEKTLGYSVPGLGLVASLLVILFIGFISSRIIGKKMFVKIEKWFINLPFIKNIYPGFKEIVHIFLLEKEHKFKKVVLVEYPSKGLWALGFVTNEEVKKVTGSFEKEMVAVFVSTTPGPFSGYVIFVAKDELKYPDISVKDAIKVLISGGVLKID